MKGTQCSSSSALNQASTNRYCDRRATRHQPGKTKTETRQGEATTSAIHKNYHSSGSRDRTIGKAQGRPHIGIDGRGKKGIQACTQSKEAEEDKTEVEAESAAEATKKKTKSKKTKRTKEREEKQDEVQRRPYLLEMLDRIKNGPKPKFRTKTEDSEQPLNNDATLLSEPTHQHHSDESTEPHTNSTRSSTSEATHHCIAYRGDGDRYIKEITNLIALLCAAAHATSRVVVVVLANSRRRTPPLGTAIIAATVAVLLLVPEPVLLPLVIVMGCSSLPCPSRHLKGLPLFPQYFWTRRRCSCSVVHGKLCEP
jgi:hypothetical protein